MNLNQHLDNMSMVQGLVFFHWIINYLWKINFKNLSNIFTSLYEENFLTIQRKVKSTSVKVVYSHRKYLELIISKLQQVMWPAGSRLGVSYPDWSAL